MGLVGLRNEQVRMYKQNKQRIRFIWRRKLRRIITYSHFLNRRIRKYLLRSRRWMKMQFRLFKRLRFKNNLLVEKSENQVKRERRKRKMRQGRNVTVRSRSVWDCTVHVFRAWVIVDRNVAVKDVLILRSMRKPGNLLFRKLRKLILWLFSRNLIS